MSNNITVSIDTGKAKELLVKETYKNKEGKDVEVQSTRSNFIDQIRQLSATQTFVIIWIMVRL